MFNLIIRFVFYNLFNVIITDFLFRIYSVFYMIIGHNILSDILSSFTSFVFNSANAS